MDAAKDYMWVITEQNDYVSKAAAMRPLLEKNAARAEADRRLPEENLQALSEAGLLDLMVPRRFGGVGANMSTILRVSAELAKACPSTAWVQTLMNASAWFATRSSRAAQEEIFGGTIRPRMCGSLAPTDRMKPVDGGFLISGRWDYTSGCWHSNWCICGIPSIDEDAAPTEAGWAFVPMSQLRIEDTWHAAGMRGTGSCTLVGEDIFVPHHRAMSLRGEHVDPDWMTQHQPEACDYWPLKPVLVLVLSGPILGMAEAALEAVAAFAPTRGIKYTIYRRRSDSPVMQHDFAEAALKIDSARFHMMRAAADVDRTGPDVEMDELTRARVRGDCGHAAKMAREAVELLVSIAGGTAFFESNPIQRLWRDIGVASRQASLLSTTDFEIYGRALLNAASNITTVV